MIRRQSNYLLGLFLRGVAQVLSLSPPLLSECSAGFHFPCKVRFMYIQVDNEQSYP